VGHRHWRLADLAASFREYFRLVAKPEANAQGGSTNKIATNAEAATSYVSPWENLLAIQNGRDPVSSTDKTGGASGNWPMTVTNWVDHQRTSGSDPCEWQQIRGRAHGG
jgi:hypothetical protein